MKRNKKTYKEKGHMYNELTHMFDRERQVLEQSLNALFEACDLDKAKRIR